MQKLIIIALLLFAASSCMTEKKVANYLSKNGYVKAVTIEKQGWQYPIFLPPYIKRYGCGVDGCLVSHIPLSELPRLLVDTSSYRAGYILNLQDTLKIKL